MISRFVWHCQTYQTNLIAETPYALFLIKSFSFIKKTIVFSLPRCYYSTKGILIPKKYFKCSSVHIFMYFQVLTLALVGATNSTSIFSPLGGEEGIGEMGGKLIEPFIYLSARIFTST